MAFAEMSFGAIRIKETSSWNNRQIKDLDLPQDCLIAIVVRGDQRIVPKGSTLLETGDEIVLCTRSFQDNNTDSLIRHPLSENSDGDTPCQDE